MIRLDPSVEHSVEKVLGVSQAVFLPTFILVKPDKLRPIVNGKRANAAQEVESFKANYLQKLRDTVEKNDFAVQAQIESHFGLTELSRFALAEIITAVGQQTVRSRTMFVYLSKKIAIPNGVKLESVAWNPEQGWIACGGQNGLLKVLKLESQVSKDSRAKGVAAPSNLSMNQTLEGHNGAVVVSTWNGNYRKLTTSDQYGLIIVWMLHKGMWFEEMINNRNKSVVRDMKWTADGQKICIIYEDGAVIVGSVDGNRLWGKELKMRLSFVEWSPDGRNILFVTLGGAVCLFDNLGNKIGPLTLYAVDEGDGVPVVGMHWYDGTEGHVEPEVPRLAIAFQNGRVQVTRGPDDDDPILIDTCMRLTQCKWNANGTVLALAGTQVTKVGSGDTREISMVQFYSPWGRHLRTLKVPGAGISALSWEGSGLRIALAVDSYIYFANIRPDYKWGWFSNTLVCAYNKSDRPEHCVVFWDTNTDDRYTKYVKKLLRIGAAGENCVLATKADVSLAETPSAGNERSNNGRGRGHRPRSRADAADGTYILILCNAIGSPIDSKYINVAPSFIAMTPCHVVVASDDMLYVWQYRTQVSKLTTLDGGGGFSWPSHFGLRRKEGRERTFHIDELPDGTGEALSSHGGPSDAICCVAASDRCLIVGRESGTLHRYSLPHLSLERKYVIRCRPQLLALNCDSTRMSIIDINGILSFFDLEKVTTHARGRESVGEHLAFERKDAWDMLWADDNPGLFAMMEKTRMYIFQGLEAEEPVLSSGYLCQHRDLEIKAVMLDEFMRNPMQPTKDSVVLDFETKSLREVRQLLTEVGINDAYTFIEQHPHPRLWRLLAEASLERLDFAVSEKAFVRCSDYQGIQFVKRLRMLDDSVKQKAEVAAYFQRFDEAEALYREIDRKDLAIELRMRLGDWFRVVQLVQTNTFGGTVANDELLSIAWNKIGDYYADRQKWSKAVQYYAQAKNARALIECYYILEEFAGLEKLIQILPEGSPLLLNIAVKFQSVGMSKNATAAFLKSGNVKAAVDCCVLLNHWNEAVRLAEKHKFPQIEGLLSKYATHLLERGSTMQAIELYRKAKKNTQAAALLANLGDDVGKTKVNPLRAKKLHVLAALEVEHFRKRTLDSPALGLTSGMTAAQSTAATLDSLMQHDAATGENKALDKAWHGAEGYHFYLLAQRQLYAGNSLGAMQTACQLRRYDDVICPVDVYSVIALTAYYNKAFGICSKAFVKLESLPSLSDEERSKYADLAMSIFIRNAPRDPPAIDRTLYGNLDEKQQQDVCVATGRQLPKEGVYTSRVYTCSTCHHKMLEEHLQGLSHCALCHAILL